MRREDRAASAQNATPAAESDPACVVGRRPESLDADVLIAEYKMHAIRADMHRDSHNPDLLILGPKMFLVWARKPE